MIPLLTSIFLLNVYVHTDWRWFEWILLGKINSNIPHSTFIWSYTDDKTKLSVKSTFRKKFTFTWTSEFNHKFIKTRHKCYLMFRFNTKNNKRIFKLKIRINLQFNDICIYSTFTRWWWTHFFSMNNIVN
jgi:hypothetical protein